MLFAYDTQIALTAAATLANSALPPDTLTSVAELDAFLETHAYTGSIERTPEELDSVRAIRPRLLALLTAERDQAAEMANAMLAEAHALPQLVRHDEWDWHLHAVASDQPLATRILVESAMGMVDVIRADEMSRLSTCDAQHCGGVVVDLSRNRSKRFCSATCGNREAVAAYRARQAHS